MRPSECCVHDLPLGNRAPGQTPSGHDNRGRTVVVEDITRASKFSEHTVRKHIRKLGLAEKIGGRLWIAREKLRDGWPSLYDRLRELLWRRG